ncbi:MAG TPA: phosphate ABC transporter permease subunit PstC [Blastocatellia bacterium]|nr:phosphate ABC transporter permease subunit PstC [Blastocatellia bacterium]
MAIELPTPQSEPRPSLGSNALRIGSTRLGDLIFKGTTLLFAFLIAALVVLIVIQMARNSQLSFAKFGLSFLWGRTWDPVAEQFGALPFVYGTAVCSVLALLIAVPVSVGVAVFLVETSPRSLSSPILFMVQLLAAIPSVVYGMWGIFVLAPFLRNYIYPVLEGGLGFLPLFQGTQNGLGMLTAGIIVSIMIVPIITAVSTDVLKAVPGTQREAALALGATKWEAALVVLENAKSGILGAVIIGLGRAVGETMAVTMLIGNRPQITASLFAPANTIASAIANEFTEATSEIYLQSLIELGLVLFVVTFIINALARLLVWSVTRGQGRGAHV